MNPFSIINTIIESFKQQERCEKIAIFGAGMRGRMLNRILCDSDICVDFFIDNNKELQNATVDSVNCVSPQSLANEQTVLVLIAVCNYDAQELYALGFSHIIDDLGIIYILSSLKDYQSLPNFFPLGHFYSLYPDLGFIKENEYLIFKDDKPISDIDLNDEKQLEILAQMGKLYASCPNWEHIGIKDSKYRHRLGNKSLSQGDAVGLHCMLRIIQPKNMIEVGSGYTSAVTLDTNEFYLNNAINIMFIEPYADLLKSLIKSTDNITLAECGLQDVPLHAFKQLEAGDILFIDSTHVSKIGSDVNYLFFEILPVLKSGVYVHLHDIFYPFEYPKDWIFSGTIWNELYILRAFLQNNRNYEIVFFQNMVEKLYQHILREQWIFEAPCHGGGIWLRKK